MNGLTEPELMLVFYQVLASAPSLLLCLVACTLVILDWRRGGRVSLWAVLGFGLAGLICIGAPLAMLFAFLSRVSSGVSEGSQFRALLLSGLILGVLQAVAMSFLLAAVLSARPQRAAVR